MQGKSHSEEVWLVSWLYKTLWMIKTIMHFISVYSLLWVCVYVCVCVCVCVCAGPALCVWSGMEGAVFQCDSEEGWGRERERERQTNMACRDCVHTVTWIRWNRTALPDRVLQIHRYTESVLRQNTADPSHIYNSSRPGETSVSARRTQDLLCVCCSICVSLSPQKRRHPVCPELMFPAHVDYIMTYYPLYYLNVYFACINLILYLI